MHHRWYTPDVPPWESPPRALLTLCAECHQEVSMASNLPSLVKKTAMSGDYGPIRAALSAEGYPYVARADLVTQTARKLGRNPDDLLRQDYWIQKEGNAFREQLMLSFSGKDIANLHAFVAFDDGDGVHWWIMTIALHFAAAYDPALQVMIFQHFAETAVPMPTAPASSTRPAVVQSSMPMPVPREGMDPLAMIVAHSQHITALAQELIRVRDTVEDHKEALGEHTRQIADLQTKIGERPGRLSLRVFVETVLRRRVSVPQTQDWGRRLARQCRAANPQWDPEQIWDVLAQTHVNTYYRADLEQFFRQEGLL